MGKTLGTFFETGSGGVIECLARGGFDYVIIDAEHGPVSVETAADCIRTAEAAGITPYVRVSGMQRPDILRMLDIGARALIVPFVETVEQVRALVGYAKFAPVGQRGYCPTRLSGWGFDDWAASPAGYMAECNRSAKLYPQCETLGAYAHIEEIVGIEGVDGIFIGPSDLSIALGVPLQFDAPVLTEAIARVLEACQKAGKQSIIFAGTPQDAKKWFARGFDSVAYSLDAAILIRACREAVAACRESEA